MTELTEWERLTIEVQHLAARLGLQGDVAVVLQCSNEGDSHNLRYDCRCSILPHMLDTRPTAKMDELKMNGLSLRIEHAPARS